MKEKRKELDNLIGSVREIINKRTRMWGFSNAQPILWSFQETVQSYFSYLLSREWPENEQKYDMEVILLDLFQRRIGSMGERLRLLDEGGFEAAPPDSNCGGGK